MAKRYVIKNSSQLGIETSWNSRDEKSHPYWYVYDKETNAIVEGTENTHRTPAYNKSMGMNHQNRIFIS